MTDDGFHRVIRYRGIFDFDGLFKFVVKWIKDHDFDFYETRVLDKPPYKIHKVMGRKKINFMVMFVIHTELWLWEAKPVQVIKNGRTKTLTEARMKILISGDVKKLYLEYLRFEETTGKPLKQWLLQLVQFVS